jgi:predicted TIM-barrel fold metal-dependent hydrolase
MKYSDFAPAKILPPGDWRIYGVDLSEPVPEKVHKVYYENAVRVLHLDA